MPVCTADYARQHQLQQNPANLRHCTLLHGRQAWSNDSGTDEWFSWAQKFSIDLPQSSGIGFDRSDLAVIAAMHHVGVAMGRKRLVQKRLESGELIAPFGEMTLECHQHYYVTTLPGRQWPKIDAFINWLQGQSKITAGVGSKGYQQYDGTLRHRFGDTVATVAGSYEGNKGFNVQPGSTWEHDGDRDGFRNKTFWGSLEHKLITVRDVYY